MKILVMGGSYFIGWHLIQKLSNNGDNEIFVFNRGTKSRKYPKNVTHLLGDRNNTEDVTKCLSHLNIDIVFDISAVKSDQTSILLSALQTSKIKKFIHISSSAVYLQSDLFPIKEDFPVGKHHIWGAYGESKLGCDQLLLTERWKKSMDIRIIRPSYVYGPYNYIPRETFLFERISLSRPIVIPGDGSAIIQLGHVKDLVNALIAAMKIENLSGEIFHISGKELITLNGLVQLVTKIMGKQTEIFHADPKDYNLTDREVFPFDSCTYFTDIEKAQNLLMFEPEYSLWDGMVECYNLWKNQTDKLKTKDFSKEDKIINRLIT